MASAQEPQEIDESGYASDAGGRSPSPPPDRTARILLMVFGVAALTIAILTLLPGAPEPITGEIDRSLALYADFDSSSLHSHLEIALGPRHKMNVPEDLYEATDHDSIWLPYPQPRFSTGFNVQSNRVRFRLQEKDSIARDLVLEISNPFIPDLECGLFYGDGEEKVFPATGSSQPFRKRPELYRYFHFPIHLDPGEAVTVVLKVNGNGGNVRMPIQLWEAQALQAERRGRLTFLSIYFCVMAVILIFGSFILAVIKTEFGGQYLAYTLAVTGMVAAFSGFGYQYLWPWSPYLQDAAAPLLANASLLAGFSLMQKLFRTRQEKPILNRLIDLLLIILGVFTITAFFEPFFGPLLTAGYTVANDILFLFCALLFAISPLAFFYRNHKRDALSFFVAIGVHAFSLVVISLERLDWYRPAMEIDALAWVGLIILNLTLALIVLSRIQIKVLEGFRLAGAVTLQRRMNMYALLKREEAVRDDVGREINRRIGPLLEAVGEKLDRFPGAGREIESIRESLEYANSEIRGISENRIPSSLVEKGLLQAIDEIARPLESAGTEVARQIRRPRRIENIDLLYQLAIFRIIQGLLNNVYKHAQANKVILDLRIDSKILRLEVQDDGVGFDTEAHAEGRGLDIIRRRVESLDGEFVATSVPGQGSDFLTLIPLTEYKSPEGR